MIVVIIVIIAGAFFLYHEGYLNFQAQPTATAAKNLNPDVPILLNISSTNNLAHLFTNENITVISYLDNSGNVPLNVTLHSYGCSFAIQEKNVYIPSLSSTSLSWSFSSSTPTSCSITFNACFNAVSYVNYPLTIESYKFSGTALTSSISQSSGLPLQLSLESFNPIIVAAPSAENVTQYITGYPLTSDGSVSKVHWLSILIENGEGYFTTSTGNLIDILPSVNITNSEYSLVFENGRLLAPSFSLLVNPVSNPIGYTDNTSMNISAGYTYCVTSNSIPITLQSS